jgi:toxin ParE1/3/4
MAKKTKITFAVSAVEDLEDIGEWYSHRQAPEVGKKLLAEVISQLQRLVEFPESGRIVPEFGVAQLREIIVPPFRVIYRLDKAAVRVVRVWRSERLLAVP